MNSPKEDTHSETQGGNTHWRAKSVVWLAGLLLALSLGSYLASRIAQLNHTIDAIETDSPLSAGGTPEIPPEVLTWTGLSLLAIPLFGFFYLCALIGYYLATKAGKASPSQDQ